MKKFLLSLLILGLLALPAFAAGPTVLERQYIQFTAADQETTVKFRIHSIVWVSHGAQDKDIAADDDMTLEDGNGTVILAARAEAVGDGVVVTLPNNGVEVTGLKAEDLDGGYLYVYGERR